ncbi:hypothetical protein L596_007197 [Steinernema carpocapsae]|uniref:Uncharacterized protein n=1 Tax=Steinernema carpocapsae TaxID=34508 RepID=A0A4U5P8I8_STECR|nr:hypothetical protein L596_007197 [Steinernema carpocapsae]
MRTKFVQLVGRSVFSASSRSCVVCVLGTDDMSFDSFMDSQPLEPNYGDENACVFGFGRMRFHRQPHASDSKDACGKTAEDAGRMRLELWGGL